MPFQPVPNTAEAAFRFIGGAGSALAGSEAQWSLYVRDTVVMWPQASLDLLAQFCADWWGAGKNGGAAASTLFSVNWSLVDILVRDLGSAGGLQSLMSMNSPGTRAGDSIAANQALLMREFGTAGGSPPKGWMFWHVGAEPDISGNEFSAAIQAEAEARLTDWRADLAVPADGGLATWAHVVVSRNLGTTVDPDPPRIPIRRATAVTNTVASIGARQEVATQRDRRPSD